MLLGVHVSAEGKIYESLDRAAALGCNTMQIFARSPQNWRSTSLDPADIKEFALRQARFKIHPVFIHVSYLINLASPDSRLYHSSIDAYIEDIMEAHALNADYIVTHMGSHKETTEESGIKRLTEALNVIIRKTANTKVGILLENTSGSGSWLGYKFSHQKKIISGIKNKERVGLCLDTAHAYAAGYDISNKNGLDKIIKEIDSMVGLGYLKLIHLNDTNEKLDSRFDRHMHIGKGRIGLTGMKLIINHPKLKNVPFILETPKDTNSADKNNLALVRKLRLRN